MSYGGVIKLTGEQEYKNALRQIVASLRETGSELTAVSSKFGVSDKSMAATKNTTSQLTSILEKQKSAYNSLKSTYDAMNAKYKESQTALNSLKSKYDEEKAKLDTIGKTLGTTSSEYQKQEKVVQDLAKEVSSATREQNNNELAMSKMKTQLNQSETAINKTTKAIDDLGEETEDSGKKANEAAKGGFTVFKGILANLGTQVITSALSGLKNLGSGLVNLGKQAIENYSEFEQLEGGVKKLFGDDFRAVIDNANNGFASAGMSANNYMDTVTSFSAALISGLNGDTAKAAQTADTAIKDMSDNANTFGSGIESIQNAYQGFAKGNFTMLDNLKLGYGGTASEMARLINESGVLEGSMEVTAKTVKDVPFDKMILAINKTQERMGIMGTTAKEASTTIEGSTNAMKSAWQNMITGIASGGDLTPLINNFVDSVLTLSQNLVPIITNVIVGFGQLASGLLKEVVPKLVEQIPPIISQTLPVLIEAVKTALQSIISVLPTIIDAIGTLIPQIIGALLEMLPDIINVGIQGIVSLISGLNKALPQLIAMLPTIIDKTVDVLIGNLGLIIDTGINLIFALIDGIIKAIPDLIEKMPEIIDKLVTALTTNLPKLIEAGIKLTIKLAEGLIKALPQLISKIPQIMTSLLNGIINYYKNMLEIGKNLLGKMISGIGSMIGSLGSKAGEIVSTVINALKDLPSKVLDIGSNLVKGLWNGINNAKNWVLDKIKGFGKSILNGLKSFFGINSPSKLMKDQVGKFLAEGVAEGFTEEMSSVAKNMQNSIPTNFDVGTNINGLSGNFNGQLSHNSIVSAFKAALSEMAVEMDDSVMGRFVEKTVARAIYS